MAACICFASLVGLVVWDLVSKHYSGATHMKREEYPLGARDFVCTFMLSG